MSLTRVVRGGGGGRDVAEPASGKGAELMGNVWVDVFI